MFEYRTGSAVSQFKHKVSKSGKYYIIKRFPPNFLNRRSLSDELISKYNRLFIGCTSPNCLCVYDVKQVNK